MTTERKAFLIYKLTQMADAGPLGFDAETIREAARALESAAQPEAQAGGAVAWIEDVAAKISSYGLSVEAARMFAQSEVEEYKAGECDCAEMSPTDLADAMMGVAADAVEKWKRESVGRPFGYKPTPPAKVPEGMIERIKAAEQRILDGHAPRRIPADPTDVDLVLAEVRLFLEGKPAPFWLAAAPAPKEDA